MTPLMRRKLGWRKRLSVLRHLPSSLRFARAHDAKWSER